MAENASARLRAEFDSLVANLAQKVREFPWDRQEAYAQWLGQTYFIVVNSTRLIAFNGALFDQQHTDFHRRFVQHAGEEANHEKLALADLKQLGRSISEIAELPETAGLWQSQAYWSLWQGPLSFYGYIFCLEGLAVQVGLELHRQVSATYGDKATNFIRVHANEDVDHLQQAFDKMAHLSNEDINKICYNLRQCCGLYCAMLDRIVASLAHESEQSRAA